MMTACHNFAVHPINMTWHVITDQANVAEAGSHWQQVSSPLWLSPSAAASRNPMELPGSSPRLVSADTFETPHSCKGSRVPRYERPRWPARPWPPVPAPSPDSARPVLCSQQISPRFSLHGWPRACGSLWAWHSLPRPLLNPPADALDPLAPFWKAHCWSPRWPRDSRSWRGRCAWGARCRVERKVPRSTE